MMQRKTYMSQKGPSGDSKTGDDARLGCAAAFSVEHFRWPCDRGVSESTFGTSMAEKRLLMGAKCRKRIPEAR